MKRLNGALESATVLLANTIVTGELSSIVYPTFWKKKGYVVHGVTRKAFLSLQNSPFITGLSGRITNRNKTCLVGFPKLYPNGNLLIRVSRHMIILDGRKTLNRHKSHARYAFIVRKPQ